MMSTVASSIPGDAVAGGAELDGVELDGAELDGTELAGEALVGGDVDGGAVVAIVDVISVGSAADGCASSLPPQAATRLIAMSPIRSRSGREV